MIVATLLRNLFIDTDTRFLFLIHMIQATDQDQRTSMLSESFSSVGLSGAGDASLQSLLLSCPL